ncbi:MAG TPA: ABC transporter permease [Thermodesulfobacteriota bacterium]|nr:ABC transporter permease [Thermodesulfobacteriota bacterium]
MSSHTFLINRELRRKFDLLCLLTRKEITLKYKRTFLGIIWSLLNPILLALVLFIAFKIFMKIRIDNYTFFFLSALFPWTWFSACVTISTGTLISNVSLIKKIRFPRHFLILATVMSQLINFLFALPIIVGLSYLDGKGPGISWLLAVPILIVIQAIVTIGICLAISIVNAYFRDMEYIIGVFITLLFWMTPIVYPLKMVPAAYQIYLTINPLTYLITAWRDLFMSNSIDWSSIAISFGSSLVFLLVGIFVFQRLGKSLDEVL